MKNYNSKKYKNIKINIKNKWSSKLKHFKNKFKF